MGLLQGIRGPVHSSVWRMAKEAHDCRTLLGYGNLQRSQVLLEQQEQNELKGRHNLCPAIGRQQLASDSHM